VLMVEKSNEWYSLNPAGWCHRQLVDMLFKGQDRGESLSRRACNRTFLKRLRQVCSTKSTGTILKDACFLGGEIETFGEKDLGLANFGTITSLPHRCLIGRAR
jgi:hypothetical protein